ncbi:MAG: c-type cytochrome [Planctomycetota bacterium]
MSPRIVLAYTLLFLLAGTSANTRADEAQWIWSQGGQATQNANPGQVAFFRKTVNLRVPARGEIEISADDRYELFVNGKSVGRGESVRQMKKYDITPLLEIGRNIVAVRVENTKGRSAGLAARVSVRPQDGQQWFNFHSNASWKVSTSATSLWQSTSFNDRLWGAAAMLGPLGDTVPFDRVAAAPNPSPAAAPNPSAVASNTPAVAPESMAAGESRAAIADATPVENRERFQIQRGFGVQRLLADDQIGSVIAMTFNEFGHMILSQEKGPLLLVFDKDEDGVPETVRTYCEDVESCQGILALNGDVFVTGMGEEGHALYRCSDRDRNGTLETVRAILKFKGPFGEHGAHGLRLGPDGMIYVSLGSHVQAVGEGGPGETLAESYEGDLVPRYEDPAGHGLGIKAPGGTIIRTNADGTVVERVAGGLRNVYDMAFHPDGSLFVHDADMEADVDTAWYRPTALFEIHEAGEFGWRTGWAKWPSYYFDRLPDLVDTGRGSPSGAVVYEHFMFPVRYQNSLFLADWSEGRILNVRLSRDGASHDADAEVFLQGQPLNVCDLEVGPDGALYFCTGGRGTAGAVYRVHYEGEIPEQMKTLGTGIAAAIRQPQIESAWARQEIASIKRDLGAQWGQMVAGVAYSDDNPPHYRTRALDLMQMFGPVPSDEVLIELSASRNETVRAKCAALMGLHPSLGVRDRLAEMLEDRDTRVQRAACEAILRSGQFPSTPDALIEMIGGDDRVLNFVARRVLERLPLAEFKAQILGHEDPHTKLVGMLAMVGADPSRETCQTVLRHAGLMIDQYLSDADFVDALRLCQVAITRGQVPAEDLTRLRDQIAEEFPAGDGRMNRELIRLAAFLGSNQIADRALEYINGDAPLEDRTLVAMYLQFLSADWTPGQRFELLKFYENASVQPTSGSLSMYIMAVTRDFAKTLSEDDVAAIIEQGAVWRNAALASLYKLNRPVDAGTARKLRNLDRQLIADPKGGDVQRRLRAGILALLATAQDDTSGEYLRRLWRTEPERRAPIAMALSQDPSDENWDYLVRSLSVLDQSTADLVIESLLGVPAATDDPMALRQLILLGVRQEQDGKPFERVERLLEHWTGLQRPERASLSMRPWQKWFAKTYPDRLPAEPPSPDESRWDFEQLVSYLESNEGRFGDPVAGQQVYTKAQCASCHTFGGKGESIGPTLTNVARRFAKRELVEAILYPGHVVSDQYASKKVLTIDGRVHIGLVSDTGGMIQIRDANNEVTEVEVANVDQILPSTSSIMPSGLLDDLSIEEIRDLMAYLGVNEIVQVASRPGDKR